MLTAKEVLTGYVRVIVCFPFALVISLYVIRCYYGNLKFLNIGKREHSYPFSPGKTVKLKNKTEQNTHKLVSLGFWGSLKDFVNA